MMIGSYTMLGEKGTKGEWRENSGKHRRDTEDWKEIDTNGGEIGRRGLD